jgi:hypothetical protein
MVLQSKLRYVSSDLPQSALEKAKHNFSMGSETQGDNDEVDDGVEYEIRERSEFFKLAVKDQFYISSIVALETAIGVIAPCLNGSGRGGRARGGGKDVGTKRRSDGDSTRRNCAFKRRTDEDRRKSGGGRSAL